MCDSPIDVATSTLSFNVECTASMHHCQYLHKEEELWEKHLRMHAVDSFWCIFDRLINESLPP